MDPIIPPSIPQKQCTTCKRFKPATLDNFTSNSSKKDGLATQCKDCKNSARRSLYVPHPHTDPSVPDGQKRCRECLICKPKTVEFFEPEKMGKDGLRATCRECRKKKARKPPKPPVTERICSTCGEVKPIAVFMRDTQRTRSGTTTEKVCRECRNTKIRQSRKDNPEPFREYDRKQYPKKYQAYREKYRKDERVRARANRINKRWRQKHREKVALRSRLYRTLHPEVRAAWRERSRERIRECKRAAYYRTSPEIRRQQGRERRRRHADRIRILNANREARQKGAGGKFTIEDIRAQYKRQKGKCYYCRKKIEWGKHHVDHVLPITRGGSNDPSNLVVACPTCNIKKHNKLLHEWPEGGRLL